MRNTRCRRWSAGPVVALAVLVTKWAPAATRAPLIPRAVIFEDSERGNPVLSPDGRHIAYSAPHDSAQAVWVRTVDREDDRVVVASAGYGISSFRWQADCAHLLYFKDVGGDENAHLFQSDIRTLPARTRAMSNASTQTTGCVCGRRMRPVPTAPPRYGSATTPPRRGER